MFINNIDDLTKSINIMQINIGKMCNLNCAHCHVEASPKHKEKMSIETFNKCMEAFKKFSFDTIDITGGEPTIHPDIIYFLNTASNLADKLILRTNAVNIGKKSELVNLLKEKDNIEIFISLPCYTKENVEEMRGQDTFDKIIAGIRLLNTIGYGITRPLNLVYNPGGAWLPPDQTELENDYKNELKKYNVEFTNLLTITNQPIGNFRTFLESNNLYTEYLELLKSNMNIKNLENIMCRFQISVDYMGNIFDCDFNQMLGLNCNKYKNIDELLEVDSLERKIKFDEHCFACIAGAGSSCGGSL